MPRATNTRFAVAVHVLGYLAAFAAADPPRPISSDELAGTTNVNPVHIRRVLGPLREAGFVRSRPGLHGGWELVRDPAGITLDEVWTLLQGDDPVLGMHGPNPQCPVGRDIQDVLEEIGDGMTRAVRAELHGRTVGDILAEVGSPHR